MDNFEAKLAKKEKNLTAMYRRNETVQEYFRNKFPKKDNSEHARLKQEELIRNEEAFHDERESDYNTFMEMLKTSQGKEGTVEKIDSSRTKPSDGLGKVTITYDSQIAYTSCGPLIKTVMKEEDKHTQKFVTTYEGFVPVQYGRSIKLEYTKIKQTIVNNLIVTTEGVKLGRVWDRTIRLTERVYKDGDKFFCRVSSDEKDDELGFDAVTAYFDGEIAQINDKAEATMEDGM